MFLSSCGGGLAALFMTGDNVQWQLSQVARGVFSNDSGSYLPDHVFNLHFACFVSLILQASYWASELTNIFFFAIIFADDSWVIIKNLDDAAQN